MGNAPRLRMTVSNATKTSISLETIALPVSVYDNANPRWQHYCTWMANQTVGMPANQCRAIHCFPLVPGTSRITWQNLVCASAPKCHQMDFRRLSNSNRQNWIWDHRWNSSLFGLVTFHMEGKVIWSGEAAIADLTLEGFGAGVFPDVTCQLVWARESPHAVLEMAFVRLFSWKYKVTNT